MEELEAAKLMQGEKLDDEMKEMVKMEIDDLSKRQVELEEKIRLLLLPKDPNDDKNVIVEIRGAAGGDEAALFAADLYRMYTRYADSQGWRVELMDVNSSDLGGFKEVIFLINGRGAYSKLKYESGAHRVQRIPATESGGRIHTSTSTVSVMPEAEAFEIDIHDREIRGQAKYMLKQQLRTTLRFIAAALAQKRRSLNKGFPDAFHFRHNKNAIVQSIILHYPYYPSNRLVQQSKAPK